LIDKKISWEVGVLLCKMIFGKYPFCRGKTKTIKDVFKDIYFTEVNLRNDIVFTSKLCIKIITDLLIKDSSERLSILDYIVYEKWFGERYNNKNINYN